VQGAANGPSANAGTRLGRCAAPEGALRTERRTAHLALGEAVTVKDSRVRGPIDAHVHEFYEVALVCRGRGLHHYGIRGEPLGPGDILLIHPSIPHAFEVVGDEPMLVRNVIFTEAALDDSPQEAHLRALFFNGRRDGVSRLSVVDGPLGAEADGSGDWREGQAVPPHAGPADTAVRGRAPSAARNPFAVASCMAAEARDRAQGYQAALRGYLLVLLAMLWRRYEAVHGTPPGAHAWQQLAPVVRRLYETAGAGLSVEQIAATAGWSPDHFGRIFREAMGQTVRAFLRQLRAQRAATLLLTSGQGVQAIAAASGYADARGMRRAFRACFGTTPELYRRQFAG
jgi:AraC-like DNA-binding protein/mannose-6-phosphate isomerase-like protein (cupin superfamily)